MSLSQTKAAARAPFQALFFTKLRRWSSETFPPIFAFAAVNLALTIIFFGFSAPSSHIGTLRPEATIAPKVLALALVGLGMGLLASIASKSIDSSLITFGVAFTVLLDLDHLPAFFSVEQPIRPAHSLMFLAIMVATLYFVLARGRPEIPVIMTSAFLAHVASDTGVFAIYAPFTFNYTSLNEFKIPLAIGAVGFAILAGYLKSRRFRRGIPQSSSNIIDVKDVMDTK